MVFDTFCKLCDGHCNLLVATEERKEQDYINSIVEQERGNTINSKFISNCMEIMMDDLDPRK